MISKPCQMDRMLRITHCGTFTSRCSREKSIGLKYFDGVSPEQYPLVLKHLASVAGNAIEIASPSVPPVGERSY